MSNTPCLRVSSITGQSVFHLKPIAAANQGLVLMLHGPLYPPEAKGAIPQKLKLRMMCAKTESDPVFSGYDQATGELDVDWSLPVSIPSLLAH